MFVFNASLRNLFLISPHHPPTNLQLITLIHTCAQPQPQTSSHNCFVHQVTSFSAITSPRIQAKMAAPSNATPTFKLVLVGDGGTGKVSLLLPRLLNCHGRFSMISRCYLSDHGPEIYPCPVLFLKWVVIHLSSPLISHRPDNIRKAPFDRRIREEIYRNSWRRSSSSRFHYCKFWLIAAFWASTHTGLELRRRSIRCVGYSRPREVWWTERWLLHQRTVRYHHVWCDLAYYLQECAKLAS